MTIDIAVIDYGMGNLRSVSKAIEHVAPDCSVVVTSDPAEVAQAGRVVFPGQGAMRDCIREMESRGLHNAIVSAARSKPFLGICIGLQMLFTHSEEGDTRCLGLLPGDVRHFPVSRMVDERGEKLKVPHMGWNEVEQGMAHPLWQGIPDRSRFYFVHSYYPDPTDSAIVAGWSRYPFRFACAVARENLFAVQFHPEKSDAIGLQLLANFVAWKPQVNAAPESGASAIV